MKAVLLVIMGAGVPADRTRAVRGATPPIAPGKLLDRVLRWSRPAFQPGAAPGEVVVTVNFTIR